MVIKRLDGSGCLVGGDGTRLYLLSWLNSGGARLILAVDADNDEDAPRSERLTLPLTVRRDLGKAALHSGEAPLTRTEEARGSNPLTSTPKYPGQSVASFKRAALCTCRGRTAAASLSQSAAQRLSEASRPSPRPHTMTTQRGHRHLQLRMGEPRTHPAFRSVWPSATTSHDDDQVHVDPALAQHGLRQLRAPGSNLGQTTRRHGHRWRPRRPGHPSRAAPQPHPATSYPSDTADAGTHGRRRPDTGHLNAPDARTGHPSRGQAPWDTGHTPDTGHRMPDTNADTVTTAQPASGPPWPPRRATAR
jgi:hypothetical protein